MAAPEVQFGVAEIYGLAAAGVVMTAAFTGGTVAPLYISQRTSHSIDVKKVQNTFGTTVGIIAGPEEILEMTIDFVPSGSTRANAITSAKFPGAAIVTIANMPVIALGAFTDAYNGIWLYLGGGTINGGAQAWTATLPLIRYIGIPTPAAISG